MTTTAIYPDVTVEKSKNGYYWLSIVGSKPVLATRLGQKRTGEYSAFHYLAAGDNRIYQVAYSHATGRMWLDCVYGPVSLASLNSTDEL